MRTKFYVFYDIYTDDFLMATLMVAKE